MFWSTPMPKQPPAIRSYQFVPTPVSYHLFWTSPPGSFPVGMASQKRQTLVSTRAARSGLLSGRFQVPSKQTISRFVISAPHQEKHTIQFLEAGLCDLDHSSID